MKVTTDGCLLGAWVSRELEIISRKPGTCNFLDIGTGTGLLAIMLAQANEACIDGIEIDKEAFDQATKNATASPWADRIKILHADVTKFELPVLYDAIVCNPPFYENELKGNDAKKNIAHHNEGLLLPQLLTVIKKNLKPGGLFYLLLPYKRTEEIKKLFSENGLGIQQLTFVRQSVMHNYFRIIVKGKLNQEKLIETMIDEIAIKNDNDKYTTAFATLLKDYYLHL